MGPVFDERKQAKKMHKKDELTENRLSFPKDIIHKIH